MLHAGYEYEIRLHRADGTLSIVLMTLALTHEQAKTQACALLRNGMANAHVWRDGELVDSLRAAA